MTVANEYRKITLRLTKRKWHHSKLKWNKGKGNIRVTKVAFPF